MPESRHCPKCDTMMDYRLGQYECPSCGTTQNVIAGTAGSGPGRSTSGPGLIVPPPAPPSTPGFQRLGGIHGHDPYDQVSTSGGLDAEKNLFIFIRMALWVLVAIAVAVAGGMAGGAGAGLGIGIFVAVLFAGLVDLALLWFVLKSDQSWAKYCCMASMALRFIGVVIALFAPSVAAAQAPGGEVIDTIVEAVQIVFDVWFFSILYRDVTSLGY